MQIEGQGLISITHVKSQVQRYILIIGRQREEIPGAHWQASVADLLSSRPMTDFVSKTRWARWW